MFALDPRVNESFTAVNRLLKAGDEVARATAAVGQLPAGTFLVKSGTGTAERMATVARELGLKVTAVEAMPGVRTAAYGAAGRPLPRVGRQHGRGLDALHARGLRVPLHAPARRGGASGAT